MLISVVIPCYNVENYIEECISSVIGQTYPNIEIICIDNNSGDSTVSKLQELKKKYPKIIIEREEKPGAPAARNKGLKMSRGEWIQFLDADDLLLPEKIQHQVNLLKGYNDLAFISGACYKQNLVGEKFEILPKSTDHFKALFLTQLGNTCSNLWNSQLLTEIGGWNEALKSSQEADLMFRLLKINENLIFDKKALTIIRERTSGQISQRDPRDKWLQYFNNRIEIWKWLKKEKKEYSSHNLEFYQRVIFNLIRQISSYDIRLAKELKEKYIPPSFEPLSRNGKKGIYFYLYKIFGFELSEKLYRFKK